MNELPDNRKDAIRLGHTQYFTGKPCKNGHIAPKYTKTCACVVCHKGYRKGSVLAVDSAQVVSIRVVDPRNKDAIQAFADQLNAKSNELIRLEMERVKAERMPRVATSRIDLLGNQSDKRLKASAWDMAPEEMDTQAGVPTSRWSK